MKLCLKVRLGLLDRDFSETGELMGFYGIMSIGSVYIFGEEEI